MISYILTERAMTIFNEDGTDMMMQHDNSNWDAAVQALIAEDSETLAALMKPTRALQLVDPTGRFTLDGDDLLFDGQPVDSEYVVRKVSKYVKEGLPYSALLKFFARCSKNPSYRVRKDLMEFIDKGELPITTDGCFLAYKYTRADGYDQHSGRVKYDVGNYVTMDRNKVDDNPDNTCSYGLHVASREYFGSGTGARFIAVRIDPADVVSIPRDYNLSKMRVCRMFILSEIEPPKTNNIWESEVVDESDYYDTDGWDNDYGFENTW